MLRALNKASLQLKRGLHLNQAVLAKPKKMKAPKGAKGAKGKVVQEPPPVEDAKLLVTRCCGLNKFIEGEDPVLKPKEEYPEWLWSLHVGKPKTYEEMDPNDKEYWYALRDAREEHMRAAEKSKKGFYSGLREHELEFQSRLQRRV